jgi:hypothetical protein
MFNQLSYVKQLNNRSTGEQVYTNGAVAFHGIVYLPKKFKLKITGITGNFDTTHGFIPPTPIWDYIYTIFVRIQVYVQWVGGGFGFDIYNHRYEKRYLDEFEYETLINNIIGGEFVGICPMPGGIGGTHEVDIGIVVQTGINMPYRGTDFYNTSEFTAKVENLYFDTMSIEAIP